MKILSISLYYKPIWPGFGTRFSELLVDETARLGHDVTLLTGRIPKTMDVEKKFKQKKFVENIGKGNVTINRLWTPDVKHVGTIKRTTTYSIFMIQCFFKVIFSKNLDLIMGLYPYPPFFISIAIIARLKKINFILIEADLWPDNLKELSIVSNSLSYSIIVKLSKWIYNASDMVIVITNELFEGLKKYFKDTSKLKVLNLATNTDIFKPMIITKKKYGTRFVIMYSGILSPNYDFDIIINSAKELKNENILFVISGAGELEKEIRNKITKLKLNNVLIEEPVKHIDDLIIKLNNADILVMGMNDNMQARTAHPSKIFEFMACGKPIICSAFGATKELILKSDSGVVVEPGNYKEFSRKILELYNSAEKRELHGKNGQNYIKKFHTLDIFRKNLSELLNKATTKCN